MEICCVMDINTYFYVPLRNTPTTEYVVPKSIPTAGPDVAEAELCLAAAILWV